MKVRGVTVENPSPGLIVIKAHPGYRWLVPCVPDVCACGLRYVAAEEKATGWRGCAACMQKRLDGGDSRP